MKRVYCSFRGNSKILAQLSRPPPPSPSTGSVLLPGRFSPSAAAASGAPVPPTNLPEGRKTLVQSSAFRVPRCVVATFCTVSTSSSLSFVPHAEHLVNENLTGLLRIQEIYFIFFLILQDLHLVELRFLPFTLDCRSVRLTWGEANEVGPLLLSLWLRLLSGHQ